jgi:hypothetical protein
LGLRKGEEITRFSRGDRPRWYQNVKVRTPSAVPSRQTEARRRAKMPTQTTPGHWLISDSSATGIGDRQAVDVEDQPAVVGDDALALLRAAAERGELARDLRRRHRDHLDRQRETAEPCNPLRFVGDADEALGEIGDDLLARQRRTAALDHAARRVDLVGAVDADRKPLDGTGVDDPDAARDEPRGTRRAARHRTRDAAIEPRERVDEEVDRRPRADADDRTARHVFERRLGDRSLELVLRHRWPAFVAPTIFAGTTQASNCSPVSQPDASAASRSVRPLLCASFAILAALS